MGKFIRKFLIFLIPLFLINLLIGVYYDQVMKRYSSERVVNRQFEAAGNIEVLICGDSHSQTAVIPALFPVAAFNFSSSGESYLQTYCKIRAILDEDSGIRTIILPFDLHSFSSFRTERIIDSLYWRRYIHPLDLAERVGVWFATTNLFEAWLFPSFYNRTFDLSLFTLDILLGKRRSKQTRLQLGYLSCSSSYMIHTKSQRLSDALRRSNEHFRDNNLVDPILVACFIDILNIAETENVNVVLVSYPVTREYRYCVQQNFGGIHIDSLATSLLNEEYCIHYFDYTGILNDHPSCFMDIDHLNIKGAQLLSSRLISDMRNSGILELSTGSGVRLIKTENR